MTLGGKLQGGWPNICSLKCSHSLHTFMFDLNTPTALVTAVLKRNGQRQVENFTLTAMKATISVTSLPKLDRSHFVNSPQANMVK